MAKTRVSGKVEWFDGVIGTNGITTMTPGTSAPSIDVQRRGARNASMGADGRSGKVRGLADTEYIWTPPDANHIFTIEAWLNIKLIGTTTPGSGGLNYVFSIRRAAEESFIFGHQGDRQIVVRDASVGDRYTGSFLTRALWEYWVIVGSLSASTLVEWRIYKKPLGGSFSLVDSRVANLGVFGAPQFKFFNLIVGGGNRWAGAVSAMSMYQLDALADATITPADVIDPPSAPISINFSPSGSATNDGALGTPILATAARINDELSYGTLDNDTVNITATNWDVGPTQILVNLLGTSGLTLNTTGEPKLHKDITNSVWTQYDSTNFPKIWQTTDGGATDLLNGTAGIIVWDGNQNPLLHPVGANIAAVAASLNTNGGYYVDATKIYVARTDGQSPSTSGTTYLRSRMRGTPPNCLALVIDNARNLTVNNFFARYTALVDQTNNDVVYGGAIHIQSNDTGFVNLVGCGGDWCGSHTFSHTSNDLLGDQVVNYINCTFPASQTHLCPYAFAGSAICSVDVPGDTSTTQQANYINCSSGADNFWLAHSDTGKLALVTFTGCNAGNGAINTYGIVANLQINGSTLGSVQNPDYPGPPVATAPLGFVNVNNGSRITGPLQGSKINVNSGVIYVAAFLCATGNTAQQIHGAINLVGCTIDVSGCTVGDATASLMYRTAAATLTMKGCVWKDGGKDIALAANFATGEIVSDYNDIGKPAANRWLETYNGADATGTQAIALGIDNHSSFSADPKVTADYKLASDSPARGLVSLAAVPALAGTIDFNGRTRAATGTTDAGALLYLNTASGLSRLRNAGARGVRVGRKF